MATLPRRERPVVQVHPFVYWGPLALPALVAAVVGLALWSERGSFPGWLLLIPVVALFWLLKAGHDVSRIEDYLLARGRYLVAVDYAPFGPGWFGRQNIVYALLYRDAEGRHYTAYCTTSYFSGVYLTEEQVAASPGQAVTFRGRTYGAATG